MNKLSYEHRSSNLPLLDKIIIEQLRKTVELFGNRDALIVPYQNYKATNRRSSKRITCIWCGKR